MFAICFIMCLDCKKSPASGSSSPIAGTWLMVREISIDPMVDTVFTAANSPTTMVATDDSIFYYYSDSACYSIISISYELLSDKIVMKGGIYLDTAEYTLENGQLVIDHTSYGSIEGYTSYSGQPVLAHWPQQRCIY